MNKKNKIIKNSKNYLTNHLISFANIKSAKAKEKAKIITTTQLLILFVLFLSINSQNSYAAEIKMDKTNFELGEIVQFEIKYTVENPDEMKVEIVNLQLNESFLLFGETSGIHKFMPDRQGKYEIIISSQKNIILKSSFEVVISQLVDVPQFLELSDGIYQNKNDYSAQLQQLVQDEVESFTNKKIFVQGETVIITPKLNSADYSLSIIRLSDNREFEFLGEFSEQVQYIPEEQGEYVVLLTGSDKSTFSSNFKVISSGDSFVNQSQFSSKELGFDDLFDVVDAKKVQVRRNVIFYADDAVDVVLSTILNSNEDESSMQFNGTNQSNINQINQSQLNESLINQHNAVKIRKKEIQKNSVVEGKNYDIKMDISGVSVKSVEFKNFNYRKGQKIGIDEFERKEKIDNKNVLSMYAINFDNLNFSTANVELTAKGTELYECKEWNFDERECYGTWRKIMDITPGQNYELLLTPGDPGYFETGIASINTNKSIYEPGEIAEVIIVVLDNQGYLVDDAQILLNITSPLGETKYYKSGIEFGNIIERKSKGIYSAKYNVFDEGYYSLSVYAIGLNVNHSMISYFLVNSTHEFDILRITPPTMDPFISAFTTTINIKFRNNYSSINITERIPINFTLESTGGAQVTQNDQYYFLKWIDLQNDSTIEYSARPPLITPELWSLQSWIDYEEGIFYEARPWYLAVDPSSYYDPNRNIATGWSTGTGISYTEVADGIRFNSVPNVGNYVRSTVGSGQISNFGFPNITEQYIDNMTLYVYAGTGSNAVFTFNLYQSGVSRCTRSLARASATQWYTCTWTNPTGSFADMSAYLGTVTKSGGGANTFATVYAIYLDVGIGNYPPNVTLLKPDNNSLQNASIIDFNFTAVDDRNTTISSCTLWANFSSSWSAIATITNMANASIRNFTRTLSDGRYIWNVNCTDGNRSAFAPANWSVMVNNVTPLIANYALNATNINQSNTVKFNVSITDIYGISNSRISLRYPNGTLVNINLQKNGDEYFTIISDTTQIGVYNITSIWANDTLSQVGQNSAPNLFFTVSATPPAQFSLISPINNMQTNNLLPTFSWQETQDDTFANYTLLIDKQFDFSSPDFKYYTYSITSTSYLVDFALDSNTIYYWKVIATDIFTSSTNSSEIFTYITDTQAPIVTLITPENNTYSTSTQITFLFNPSEINTLEYCELYTNKTGIWMVENYSSALIKNQTNSIQASLNEGYTKWNIRCVDNSTNSAFAITNKTIIIDLTGPNVELLEPANNIEINYTNIINFTARANDSLGDVASCSLIVNNEIKQTIGTIVENENISFVQFLGNGEYVWSVNCTDTNGLEKASVNRNLNITSYDFDAPVVLLNSPSQFEHLQLSTVTFNYAPLEATGIINCSIYIDGSLNKTNTSVLMNENNYFTIAGIAQGEHEWKVDCIDNSSMQNLGSSSINNFTVDLTNPIVNLNSPSDVSLLNYNNIELKYVPIDENIYKCYLWTNSSGIWQQEQENDSMISAQENLFYATLASGNYIWNVECLDKSLRSAFSSLNKTFTIDTTAPSFSSINVYPISPQNYSSTARYDFNITWIDNLQIQTVILENNFSGVISNKTLEFNGVYNFSVYNLSSEIYYYKWYAKDTAGNTNSTPSFLYQVQKALPDISLQLNGFENNLTVPENSNVNITAILYNPLVGNLSLYINGTLANFGISPISNMTYFSNPGKYNITIIFTSTNNYLFHSKTLFVNVSDTISPNVTLLHPQNNSLTSSGEIAMQYEVEDYSNISSCSLYINNLFNQIQTQPQKNVTNTFLVNLNEGAYNWRVECIDSSANLGMSKTFNFSAIDTDAMHVEVNTKSIVERGEILNITITTTDVFSSPISADVKTDIIKGITSLDWWNSSWQKRKPIYFNETKGVNQINALAEVNLTNLNISSCNEIRIIHNESNNFTMQEIPYEIYSGNNLTWCYAAFRINLSANSINNNDYYVYYNNSLAQNPNYNIITTVDTSYFAVNAAADEGTVTTSANIIGNNDATYATISITGGGAGATSAHGRDFINSVPGGEILKVQARYRYEVTASSGNWYLRYSVDDGALYNTLLTGTTTQAKLTSPWNDITTAYSSLTWSELNRTRLQGRSQKGSGSGTTTMYLFWVELNVTSRIVSNITSSTVGAVEEFIYTNLSSTNVNGDLLFNWTSSNNVYGNYSVVSRASKINYRNALSTATFELVKDVTPPLVTLLSPENFDERGVGFIDFSYNVFDINLANCSFYSGNISELSKVTTDTSLLNGENLFEDVYFALGEHLWNVECFDSENNSAFSQVNFTLNITGPDLVITENNIWFGDESRIEGVNITVYANITNEGLTSQNESFVVRFYFNNPYLDGVQINEDIIIPNLSIGETITISTQHNLIQGTNNIFVFVDEDNLANESDETNNIANKTIDVDIYNYYYGNVSGKLILSAQTNSFLEFGNQSNSSGHIFFADADSSFSFTDLQALTRNKLNQAVGNDFTDIDEGLNTTNYADSIKNVWGNGADSPIQTKTFNLSTGDIENVPIANSTTTNSFVTGILWDTSDDAGNLQYDSATKEDIVFVTQINRGQMGEYGIYDTEIRIPANLKEYKEGSENLILYVELE